MSIVFAILLFVFLILIHEFGHFVAAKLSGVQVNEFAIFMGPAIFKKQRGETLYSLRCIPLGGYCAMEGEDGESDNPRAFQRAAWWKRLIILAAGAAMNFLVGVVIFAALVLPSREIVRPVLTEFTDCCTFHSKQGLLEGDEILELDGEKIYTNSNVSMLLSLNPTGVHDIVVERDGQKLEFRDLPMAHTHENEDGTVTRHYGITIGKAEPATLGQRLSNVWNVCLDNVRTVRLSLKMLLTGQAGFSDMAGPVGIVSQMTQIAEASGSTRNALLNLLSVGGFIAINLAVMNLLPIPALDGGRIVGLLLTTAVEAITRKKINPKYEGYLHSAGMILLFVLMAVILFKDIFVLIWG